ncbi:MAG: hypothetical protein HYZ57_15980 [Acidobacteria bacterium]|nr:hypothetical protein [Acidobacteriota bacterium]
MALFTDGSLSTVEDLRRFESSILEVAATESIELALKLDLAQREMSVELSGFLKRNGDPLATDLTRVVTTDALARWHTLHTLELIYRDAYSGQSNDRYLRKRDEYCRFAASARDALYELGVGIVYEPLARPRLPSCASVAGGALAEATYYVQVAAGLEEQLSAASELTAIQVSASNLLTVTLADPADAPSGGFFHVYVGTTPDALEQQNTTGLAPDATWTMPQSGLSSGAAPPSGQQPDFYVVRRRQLQRG